MLTTSELAVAVMDDFDLARFAAGLEGAEASAAFTADLQKVRYHRIGCFPTIVKKSSHKAAYASPGCGLA